MKPEHRPINDWWLRIFHWQIVERFEHYTWNDYALKKDGMRWVLTHGDEVLADNGLALMEQLFKKLKEHTSILSKGGNDER